MRACASSSPAAPASSAATSSTSWPAVAMPCGCWTGCTRGRTRAGPGTSAATSTTWTAAWTRSAWTGPWTVWTRCAIRRPWWGSAAASRTRPSTCATTTSARRSCWPRCTGGRRVPPRTAWCSPARWWSTARAATAADATGRAAPPGAARGAPRNAGGGTKRPRGPRASASMRGGGPPVTALRYHNVYGPRMPRDTPYSGVAAIFRSALEAGRAPRVLEDGRQRRDFVHVRDVARANVLALLAPEPVPGAFNVASGEPHTVGELAAALAGAMGGPAPVVAGGWRPGDVRHVFASPALAAKRLGFRAEVPFATGIAELATAPLRAPAELGSSG